MTRTKKVFLFQGFPLIIIRKSISLQYTKKLQDSKHMGYNIRSLYTPVQPAVMSTDGEVSYIELPLNAQLQDFIYWSLKTIMTLNNKKNHRMNKTGVWEAPKTE